MKSGSTKNQPFPQLFKQSIKVTQPARSSKEYYRVNSFQREYQRVSQNQTINNNLLTIQYPCI